MQPLNALVTSCYTDALNCISLPAISLTYKPSTSRITTMPFDLACKIACVPNVRCLAALAFEMFSARALTAEMHTKSISRRGYI